MKPVCSVRKQGDRIIITYPASRKVFIERASEVFEQPRRRPKVNSYPKQGRNDPWYPAWEKSRREEALKRLHVSRSESDQRAQIFINAAIGMPLNCSKISKFTPITKTK